MDNYIVEATVLTVSLIATASYFVVLLAGYLNGKDYLAKWSKDVF